MDLAQIPSPCYVLDEAVFESNLDIIESVQKAAGVEIILALKGFSLWKLFPKIKNRFPGATASSLNEALLVREEFGLKPHLYAPAYSDSDLDALLPLAHSITFNSLSQWERHREKLKKPSLVSPGLRINPGFSPVATPLYNPCAPGSRLGVSLEKLPRDLPDGIEGLHVHNLCESSADDLTKTLDILENKAARLLKQARWLNLGGGHLMTRSDYDGKKLIQSLLEFKSRHELLQILLEPSAAFVWQAGVLRSQVLDVVEDSKIKTAILDTSFTAHMPDCLEMPYQPEVRGAVKNGGKHRYRLGGTTCLSGDFLGDWGFDQDLVPGDSIVFEDMIQYTMVKTSFFNGVRHPSIGIWKKEGRFELLREFGYEDYKARLC